jgi:hypothetical protein
MGRTMDDADSTKSFFKNAKISFTRSTTRIAGELSDLQ